VGKDFVQPPSEHDRIQSEESDDQEDRDANGLAEPLQKDDAQQGDQADSYGNNVVVQRGGCERVLDNVSRSIGGRKRDCDDEISRDKSQQCQDEQLARPERQQVLKHRDRTVAMRAVLSYFLIDRESAKECDKNEDKRGDRREDARSEGGDARLVAQRGEIVDPSEAHDLVPRMGFVTDLGLIGSFGVLNVAFEKPPVKY
jgi:hypothetical protein